MLDTTTAKSLAAVGVNSAQVTFDSLIYEPGTKRGVITSGGQPSIILRNLKVARDYLKIRIRLNLSASNSTDLPQITNVLDTHGFSNSYHLARVIGVEEQTKLVNQIKSANGAIESGRCLTAARSPSETLRPSVFARLECAAVLSRQEEVVEAAKKLIPRDHFCGATTGAMFVISPDGSISCCWEDAGIPSHAMGNVLNEGGILKASEAARRWEAYTPFAYPNCVNCDVFPVCMGGCPFPRVMMGATNEQCIPIRYQIWRVVEEIATRLILSDEQRAAISSDDSKALAT